LVTRRFRVGVLDISQQQEIRGPLVLILRLLKNPGFKIPPKMSVFEFFLSSPYVFNAHAACSLRDHLHKVHATEEMRTLISFLPNHFYFIIHMIVLPFKAA